MVFWGVVWGSSMALAQVDNAMAPRIQVGKPFPDLSFPSLIDGKLTSVSAFRGKKTILHVFASW